MGSVMNSVEATPVPQSRQETPQPNGSAVASIVVPPVLSIVADWDSTGKDQVVEEASSLASKSPDPAQSTALISIFYDLLEATTTQKLTPEQVSQALIPILSNGGEAVASLLVHTASLFVASDGLRSLLGTLVDNGTLDRASLLRLMDMPSLLALDIAKPTFERAIVKENTNLLYKQKRFNLLREESEGYAKLIVEVYTAANSKNSMALITSTARTIETLIGYFDLDPVRSLDVLLDVAAANIVGHCTFFSALFKESPWWPSQVARNDSLDNLDRGGSRMAAQLLGFKLRNLDQDESVDPVTRDALTMFVAVAIKEGFVSLGDVYTSLSPSDDELANGEDQWKKDMEKEAYMATASALALAAPLEDEGPPTGPSADKQAQKEQKKENEAPQDAKTTKAALVESLLAVGAVYPALFILSRFPYLANSSKEAAALICRLFEYMIDPLYAIVSPFRATPDLLVARKVPTTTSSTTWLVDRMPSITRKTLSPLRRTAEGGVVQKFFYEKWTEGVVQIETVEDLNTLSEIWIKLAGPLLSTNLSLLTKLCRIGLYDVKQGRPIEYWVEYFRLYILPAVSMIDSNPAAMYEIYCLVRLFSFETRYALYGEWNAVLAKASPHLKMATAKAAKDTKNILKRLSKTNVQEMMRKLAKVSFSNPIPTFTALISQVESYDNLSELIVDAARYFTDLGWDVLPFVIMTQLTSGRGTYQLDGLSDRKWIQSLASFTAKLCKRYAKMDPRPILMFLLRQLHSQKTSEVIVLRELINQMVGISQLSNVTSAQVEGLGGGPELQSTVFKVIDDQRLSCVESASRLVSSLCDLKILTEMFIILAQIQKTYIYNIDDALAHQKFLSYRYDDLTHLLLQYTEMVNFVMKSDEIKNNMLPVADLCLNYGVSTEWAFGLWRATLSEDIRAHDTDYAKEQPWHPILADTIERIRPILPDSEWEYLKPGFYVTFWQLSLYDISYPEARYKQQEEKLREHYNNLTETIRSLERERGRESAEKLREKKAEKEGLLPQLNKLVAESKRHALHYNKTRARLELEKDHWFSYNVEKLTGAEGINIRRQQTRHLLAHCILPRALHSPIDAIYCANFVRVLHSFGTVNFSTLSFFDKLFADGILYGTLLTCTPYEAENLGLFFSELLGDLNQWRSDPELYEKEGLGRREDSESGKITFLPGLQLQFSLDEVEESSLLSYDQLRRALEKWHRHTCSAVVDCLRSEDYMHRRNTMTLLKNMIGVFPAIVTHGWRITDAIEAIAESDPREDLKLSALALSGLINQKSKDWIELYDFKPLSAEAKGEVIREAQERERLRREKNKPVRSRQQSAQPEMDKIASPATQLRSAAMKTGTPAVEENGESGGGLPASLPRIPSAPRRDEERRRGTPTGPREDRGNAPGATEANSIQIKEPRVGSRRDRKEREREREREREHEREKRLREREQRDRERDRERERERDIRDREHNRDRERSRRDKDRPREKDRTKERREATSDIERRDDDRARGPRSKGGESVPGTPRGKREGRSASSTKIEDRIGGGRKRDEERRKEQDQQSSQKSQQQPQQQQVQSQPQALPQQPSQSRGRRGGGRYAERDRERERERELRDRDRERDREREQRDRERERRADEKRRQAPPPPPPPPPSSGGNSSNSGGGGGGRRRRDDFRDRDRDRERERDRDYGRRVVSGANSIEPSRKHERSGNEEDAPGKRRRTRR
ncbi:THO complex subunit 2 [Trichomonascus vanleenenianus]|uniref:Tho2p n=1 Tax=Trichomonascus vanleenenianus TaxID=2268995 RepID=UPI003ECAF72A